jgi:hypothetical protein
MRHFIALDFPRNGQVSFVAARNDGHARAILAAESGHYGGLSRAYARVELHEVDLTEPGLLIVHPWGAQPKHKN